MQELIRIAVVLVTGAFAFRALPANADEPAKSAVRKVIASSTATVMVKPDAARISFRIGASEDPGKSAHEANEAQVKKLRAALEAQPIDLAMMDIQVVTGGVNPTVLADPNRPNDRTLKSKRAETV